MRYNFFSSDTYKLVLPEAQCQTPSNWEIGYNFFKIRLLAYSWAETQQRNTHASHTHAHTGSSARAVPRVVNQTHSSSSPARRERLGWSDRSPWLASSFVSLRCLGPVVLSCYFVRYSSFPSRERNDPWVCENNKLYEWGVKRFIVCQN